MAKARLSKQDASRRQSHPTTCGSFKKEKKKEEHRKNTSANLRGTTFVYTHTNLLYRHICLNYNTQHHEVVK